MLKRINGDHYRILKNMQLIIAIFFLFFFCIAGLCAVTITEGPTATYAAALGLPNEVKLYAKLIHSLSSPPTCLLKYL